MRRNVAHDAAFDRPLPAPGDQLSESEWQRCRDVMWRALYGDMTREEVGRRNAARMRRIDYLLYGDPLLTIARGRKGTHFFRHTLRGTWV